MSGGRPLIKDQQRQRERPSRALPFVVLGLLILVLAAFLLWRVFSSEGGETVGADNPGPPSFEQSGAYTISDPQLVSLDADTYEIVVDAEWVEEGEPARKGCSYVVYAEGTNEVLINEAFTLFLPSGQEERTPVAMIDAEDLQGSQPGTVDVRCQS